MAKRIDPWLALLVVGCSVFAAVLVCRTRQWSVMTDELLYTEMARGMLGSGLPIPNVRGEYVQVYQVLYPMLIAPVLWVVGMPEAYQAIAVVNAVAITSACVPAYLLTNYVTGDRVLARWVALCTGVLPWIALGTKILTDSLAYPVFIWAVYAIVLAVADEDPAQRRRRDVIALAAIAAAYMARSQFVILPPVFAAAILARAIVTGAGDRARAASMPVAKLRAGLAGTVHEALRAPLRRKLVFGVTLAVVALVMLKPNWILGIYAAATSDDFGPVVPGNLFGQLATHLGMIAIGIGVVPLVLALPWLTSAIGRADDARQNATALTIAICSLVLLFLGTSFDMRFSRTQQVYERYIFYIAPLLLIGTAALFKHPPKRWLAFVVPALAGVLLFARDDHYGLDDPLTISISQSFKPVAIFQIALQRVVDASGFLPSVTTGMAILATLTAVGVWLALTRGARRTATHATFGFICFYCVWATVFTVPKVVDATNRAGEARFGLRTSAQKTWVDGIAGQRDVSLIYNSINFADGRPVDGFGGEQTSFWDIELWNSSIRSFYTPFADEGVNSAAMQPYHRLRVRFTDGLIRLTGGEPAPLWLMSSSDPRFAPLPAGSPTREHFSGLTVYPVPAQPRADWATRGLTYHGFVPALGPATLRVYAVRGQSGERGAEVRMVFEKKRRADVKARFGARRDTAKSKIFVQFQTLCLPAGGRQDIDLREHSAGFSDSRYAARLVGVQVARDGADGCSIVHRPF